MPLTMKGRTLLTTRLPNLPVVREDDQSTVVDRMLDHLRRREDVTPDMENDFLKTLADEIAARLKQKGGR